MYNALMADFHFKHPISVRYGDLDPQWHVNNAKFLVFIEQTRFAYLVSLGLFDGKHFFDLGLIVADIHVAYLKPIEPLDKVEVAARVAKIGNKSILFEARVQNPESGELYATSEIVMVAYDYHTKSTRPVPPEWREKIAAFEQWEQPQ